MTEHAVQETMEPEANLAAMKAEQESLREQAERKRLESYWWGAVFVWAGLVFFADYLEFLPQIREEGAWSWIFLGAGIFGLVGALVRVVSADLPEPSGWDYFWSGLFLIIGATGFFGGGIAFPIVIIVLGLAILGSVLFRHE